MTNAEKCKKKFEWWSPRASVVTIARSMGARRERRTSELHYTFPDGSKLITFGRGRSHQMRLES